VRRFESFSNLITIRVHRYRIIARRCPKSKAVRDCFHSFKSVTHDRSAVKPGERAALIFYLIHCCEIFAGIFVIPFVIPLSIRRTKLPTFFLFLKITSLIVILFLLNIVSNANSIVVILPGYYSSLMLSYSREYPLWQMSNLQFCWYDGIHNGDPSYTLRILSVLPFLQANNGDRGSYNIPTGEHAAYALVN